MQALARRRGLLGIVAAIVLLVLGVVLFRSPLEIPSLQIAPLACIGGEMEGSVCHGGYPLRSSVVQTWLAMLVLIVIVSLATRRMEIVPGRLQALVETVIEGLLGLVEQAAGKKNGRRFFPVVVTIFLFVISMNWLGLLPGVGTIGVVVPAEEVIAEHMGEDLRHVELLVFNQGPVLTLPLGSSPGEMTISGEEAQQEVPAGKQAGHLVPFLRPGNTDINTPLAIAIWSFIFVEFWGVSTLGLFSYLGKFFNFRRLLRGQIVPGVIDVFVGLLELLSELVRLVSFTFRLFGNIFAGEVLVLLTSFFFPLLLVVGVFAMELFFGMIQAFIFAILTLIFGVMAVTSHHEAAEEHGEGREAEHAV